MNFLRRRIPVLLVICVLFTGIAGGVYLFFSEPTAPPQNIRITNITDQSLTISWITNKPTYGFIFVSDKSWRVAIPFFSRFLVDIFSDDHRLFSTIHHASLQNLKPETNYYYEISTGLHTYNLSQVKTASALEDPTFPNPAYGKVLENDGITLASGVIIYFSAESSNELSTITNDESGWTIDLANLRSQDLKSSFPLAAEGNTLYIKAEGGSLGKAGLILDTSQDAPASDLVLQ